MFGDFAAERFDLRRFGSTMLLLRKMGYILGGSRAILVSGGVSPYLLHMTRSADLLIQLEEYFCCRAGLDFCTKLEYGRFGLFRCLVRRIA